MISEIMFLQRKQEIKKAAEKATEFTHLIWEVLFLIAIGTEAAFFGACCFGYWGWGNLLYPVGAYACTSVVMMIVGTIQRYPYEREIQELENQRET